MQNQNHPQRKPQNQRQSQVNKNTTHRRSVHTHAESTSWGNVSDWYDEYMQDSDTYQAKVIAPNLLRILGVRDVTKNISILDLGCGQGYFLNHVLHHVPNRLHANLYGVDISQELLDIAKIDLGDTVTLAQSDASKLVSIPDRSMDIVYCVLALQNMQDLNAVMSEVQRVLKKEGKFVCVLNHPAFRIPKQSDWHADTTRHAQGRVVYTYMSDKKFAIDMHPGKTAEGLTKKETFSFHHPLQYYMKIFAKHGLAITKLEEWISHKISEDGPKKEIEDNARKEIPMFMCIELKVLQ
jgi:ubiquinone/menaquinone biosynthesis C-methylase UbiE